MKKTLIGLTIIVCGLTISCSSHNSDKSKDDSENINKQAPFYSKQLPPGNPRVSKKYDSTKVEKYDPFIIYKDGSYMIAAEIESKDLFNKYNPIFEKYEYSGNDIAGRGTLNKCYKKKIPRY